MRNVAALRTTAEKRGDLAQRSIFQHKNKCCDSVRRAHLKHRMLLVVYAKTKEYRTISSTTPHTQQWVTKWIRKILKTLLVFPLWDTIDEAHRKYSRVVGWTVRNNKKWQEKQDKQAHHTKAATSERLERRREESGKYHVGGHVTGSSECSTQWFVFAFLPHVSELMFSSFSCE